MNSAMDFWLVGALTLIVVGLVSAILITRRPTVAAFAAAQGVEVPDDVAPTVDAWLQRTRRWRRNGALITVALAALFVLITQPIWAVVSSVPLLLPAGIFGGLVGMALAQIKRSDVSEAVHVASLDVRTVRSYRPRSAQIATAVLFTVAVSALLFQVWIRNVPLAVFALVVVGVCVGTLVTAGWCERRIAARARDAAFSPSLDDAVRRVGVHALRFATVGLLACFVAFLAWNVAFGLSQQVVRVGGEVVFRFPAGTTSIGVSGTSSERIISGPDAAMIVEEEVPVIVSWTDGYGDHSKDLGTIGRSGDVRLGFDDRFQILQQSIVVAGFACFLVAVFAFVVASRAWKSPAKRTSQSLVSA